MAEINDIRCLPENQDLAFSSSGDLIIGESTSQHQEHILLHQKGEFKEAPWLGVGIGSWLKDDSSAIQLRREIRDQFETDGMEVREILITGDLDNRDVEINAIYK